MRIPWWLWPNVLSLDAPIIAVLWQRFFAHCWGIHLRTEASIVLGMAVWVIYVIDRCWDTYNKPIEALPTRHLFVKKYLILFLVLALAVGGLSFGIAVNMLYDHVYKAGLIVASLIAGYLFIWQVLRIQRLERTYIKEIMVGSLFAVGSTFNLFILSPDAKEWLHYAEIFLFSIACTLNCITITWAESNKNVKYLHRIVRAELFIALGLIMVFFLKPELVMAPFPIIALSLIGLAIVQNGIDFLSHQSCRVLADAVLLTPLIAFILQKH
jgi:hypothetical protein